MTIPRLPVVVERKGIPIILVISPSRSSTVGPQGRKATDHVKNQIRYATASFDGELTQLEGA